ncbi:MAG: PaaI family thioesterase [Opitutaceae bacterium]|jgi:acyl-CoA thioesterase
MSDLKAMSAFFQGDLFAKHCGIELVSLEPGYAVAKMKVQPWHFNAVGIVQGGAIFTLADYAFAVASNTRGNVAVAVNVSITFTKAAKAGVLSAEAREVSFSPKLASYTVNVADEAGSLIAVFQGLVYRKKESIPGLQGQSGSVDR